MSCPLGHPLRDERGVIVLVPPTRRADIASLEVAVREWRAARGQRALPADALPALPSGPAVAGDLEWRLRRHDLRLVTRLIAARARARVLDIGAWNGWLSHNLAVAGHDVTAADVFAGPEALGAPWPVEPSWRRVQVDPTELDRLEEAFDVVILDRCLQFFPDPVTAVTVARGLVRHGGLVVATGLMVHRSGEVPARRIAAEEAAFRERFGRELFLHATKGYLDRSDIARLAAAGLAARPYPGPRLADLRARFDPTRPVYRYGTAHPMPHSG